MIRRRTFLASAFATPFTAAQAQVLPGGRSMRWVVPYPPGGAGDAVARNWAAAYTSATGQTIVVDNRGGANGMIGLLALKDASHDGNVLGVLNISLFTALPLMMAKAPLTLLATSRPLLAW